MTPIDLQERADALTDDRSIDTGRSAPGAVPLGDRLAMRAGLALVIWSRRARPSFAVEHERLAREHTARRRAAQLIPVR